MSTSKTEARKRLQVKNDKYRENYERIFGQPSVKVVLEKDIPVDSVLMVTHKEKIMIENIKLD